MGLLSRNMPVLISGPLVSSMIAHVLLGLYFIASFKLSTICPWVYTQSYSSTDSYLVVSM